MHITATEDAMTMIRRAGTTSSVSPMGQSENKIATAKHIKVKIPIRKAIAKVIAIKAKLVAIPIRGTKTEKIAHAVVSTNIEVSRNWLSDGKSF